jgi:DNA-binding transcriptional MerR regulator
MRIGEVAAAAGVNVETLRYYERRGLLGAPPRTAHGYRMYDLDTVRFVRSIKEAQGLGFSLTEIEEYLRLTGAGAPASDAMRARVGAKLTELDAKIESLERMRAGLGRLLYCTCASPDRCTCGAAQLARRGREPASAGTLHVTNGASAGNSLQHTSLAGTVLVWSDLFAEGPLAPVQPPARLRELRARFWAGSGAGVEAALAAEMERRDELFAEAMAAGRHVVVWLEHDLLDQLQLVHILATIVALGHDYGNVELIVVDEVEGHPGFRGLGELEPRELEALWPRRVPLRPEAAELGARAWAAAAAPDPTTLAELLDTDTSALPLLAPALRRWLEELPDTAAGLALSERQILELLADGPRTRHELFLAHMERETVLFNGDAWFFDRIAGLGPLVTGTERVEITDLGRRVLAGELDRVEVAGLDRWLGGTHLTRGNTWRRERGGLVAPE